MKTKIFYFLSIMVLMASCYPGGAEYYEDTDVVYTHYENDTIFNGKKTYAMPDKIVKITGEIEDKGFEFVKEPMNTQLVNLMKDNMENYGWELVDTTNNPDLVLLPAVWTNTSVYYYYDYWCWYYYYYCGWGYPSVSSYTTGTLIMTLVAYDEDTYIEPLRVWTGAINGLLSGSYNTTRVTKGINQAFTQSQYLDRK